MRTTTRLALASVHASRERTCAHLGRSRASARPSVGTTRTLRVKSKQACPDRLLAARENLSHANMRNPRALCECVGRARNARARYARCQRRSRRVLRMRTCAVWSMRARATHAAACASPSFPTGTRDQSQRTPPAREDGKCAGAARAAAA